MTRTTMKLVSALSLLLLLSMFSISVFAQREAGQITGTVRDTSGAVLAGAKVTAKSATTGYTRDTTTNSVGLYTIPSLRPDTYDVTVEMTGFQTFTRRVEVAVGSSNDVSAQLGVTGGATTVEVTGASEAATVNTENQTLSQVITSKDISDLPTLTRNPYDLVAVAGNVQQDNNSMRGAGYAINGQRSASTDILLDGGENVDMFTAQVGQQVPLDSVQEFSVLTNSFTAEYGRAGGGVVNVVTKSGTNAFHGSAYEFNRISALSSNTFFNNANGIPQGRFTRNQFGYSIGGPVVKNKLFFFNSTEWIRVRGNSPTSLSILAPSSIPATAPATQAFFNQFGKLAPGVSVLNTVPCGTLTCEGVTFPVTADSGGGNPQNSYETVARVDYNITDKTTLFGRYALYSEDDFPGSLTSSPYAGFNTGQTFYNQNATINLTHIFTPSIVDTTKLVYNRLTNVQPLGPNPVGPTLYTTSAGTPALSNGLSLVFPGYSATTPGNAIPFGGPQNLYQIYNDLSWTKGRHQFKFGGSYIQTRDNREFGAYENAVEALGTDLSSALANLQTGNLYEFQGAIYPQGKFPCPKNSAGTVVQSPACTLTLPVTAPQFSRNNRYNDGSAYVQDSWKVVPRFTFNIGLRWEYYGVQHNANPNLDSNLYLGSGATLFNQIRNGTVQIAPQSPVGGLWNTQPHNFGPRAGFAWDVFGDGRTAIRGGYGISYERNFGNVTFNVIQNPPNYAVMQLFNTTAGGPLPIFVSNTGPLVGTGTAPVPATSLRAVNTNIKTAYAQTWNLTVEHEVMKNSVFSLGYAGSKGTHLYDISNINPATGGSVYLGDTVTDNRLNYQYNNINYRSDDGYSIYNALNVRFATTNIANKGLNMNVNYSWSHSLDNLSSTFSELGGTAGGSGIYYLGYTDAFNPSLDYGNSDFDVRHRLSLAGTYDIAPWLKNSSNKFVREGLGGWSIGSSIIVHSGSPFSVFDCSGFNGTSCPRWAPGAAVATTGSASASTSVGPDVFNYIGLPSVPGTLPDGTSGPVPVGIGNSLGVPMCTGLYHVGCTYTINGAGLPVRNSFVGPGYWNVDLNAYKTFKLSERFNLQVRGEFYNIFNHSNQYISLLNLDVSSMTTPFVQSEKGGIFGIPGQPSDERRNLQFALKLTF